MKTTYFLSIFLLITSNLSNAQVGINTTTPSAMLDIISDNTTDSYTPLQIKNSADDVLISVNNSGDLRFRRALMPNNDAGQDGDFLISKGPDLPPVWGPLQNHNGRVALQEFNARRNAVSSESIGAQTYLYWDFPTVNVTTSPEIGTWNSATRSFNVNKTGVYHITAGGEARNLSSTTPNLLFVITAGGSFQAGGNINFIESSQRHISAYSVLSIVLHQGDTIRVGATSGNSTWTMGTGFINIQYSEID